MNATTNIPSSNFDGEGNETLDRKETEIRIDSKGDQPEKDDALIHDKIDKPDDIDKYSGYDLHNESTDADKLMDAIIALDDAYRTGDISEEVYRKRRGTLKEELKKLV